MNRSPIAPTIWFPEDFDADAAGITREAVLHAAANAAMPGDLSPENLKRALDRAADPFVIVMDEIDPNGQRHIFVQPRS